MRVSLWKKRYSLTPAWGRQPAERGQVIAIFLMSFTCSSRKWFCRKSQRYRGLCRQNAGHAEPKQPGSGSFPRPLWLPWCPGLYLTYCEWLLHVPEVSVASTLVLHLQEMLGNLKLLLGQLEEEVSGPSPVEPPCLHRNRSLREFLLMRNGIRSYCYCPAGKQRHSSTHPFLAAEHISS